MMGLMYMVVALISLISWLIISKKPFIKQDPYHANIEE